MGKKVKAKGQRRKMGLGKSKQCWVPVNEKLAEKVSEVETWDKEEDLTGWLACNDAGKLGCIASCQSTGRLNLAFNGIGDREAEAFAKGLKSNTCINTLVLANNNIHSVGASQIFKAMMPGNNRKEVNGGGTKVEELDFRNNFMGNDSATDLASLLGANRVLVRYNISFNGLGNSALWKIVFALKPFHAKDLVIDVSYNGFDINAGCNPEGGDSEDWAEMEEYLQKINVKRNDYNGSPPRGILGWPR